MKKRIRTIWTGVLCLCPVLALQAGWGDLQEQLRRMVADKKAQVGIAVIVDGRDTLTVNNDVRYPMMSVFKFHQALAVADACGRRGVSFDTLVHIRPVCARIRTVRYGTNIRKETCLFPWASF